MTEKPKADQNELNIQDLALARAIIELASERNAFKVGEMASVGMLYNKLDAFLKEVEAQAKAAQEGAKAAQAPADTAPETNEESANA